ncbi:ATP-binding protein [Stella sp.]|uniref:ATP-binding protein n=1 Tax=Stella sp. TaxID=2912054 RepID=UPI0035B10758
MPLPDSIAARVIAILMVGLGISHVGSIWIYEAGGHGPPGDHASLIVSTTVMALGILAVSILLVRWLTAPLRTLAAAADRLGRDMAAAPVAEAGPRELRLAAAAFNRMQARLQRMVAERTETLAAVSHDLRTPITRLRLRAELVEDPDLQRAIAADLDEMEAMVDSALAFLRGDGGGEPARPVDVAALVATVVSEAADAGRPARLEEDGSGAAAVVTARPILLKRALANLVDNAVKHGGAASVSVRADGGGVVVAIADPGPGIAPAERAEAFTPFRRLGDPASAPAGSGLGLTVARAAVEAHGGTIRFDDPPGGGFRVLVTLPRKAP